MSILTRRVRRFAGGLIPQPQRPPGPGQGQLLGATQAEFVICDQTIEEMFGDWKGHGWDLQTTHLRHPDRLSRLVLAICLLYVWLVLYGVRVIKAGWRDWVDRHDRRDLSLFRIGGDTLQRCFTLVRPPPVALPNLLASLSVR